MKNFKKSFDTNGKRLFCFVLCLFVGATQAALPSDFQNEKDLADIVSYIKSEHEVLTDLRIIDLAELTVYYGNSCRIKFARKVVKREAGWVGPAEPVEFKTKQCMDSAEASSATQVPEGKVKYGIITSSVVGGALCHLQIKDDAGDVHDELASFSLCEDKTVLDKPSEFIYEQIQIMVTSCQGDSECPDTEPVWLIGKVKAL